MLDPQKLKVLVAYIAVSKGPITADYCARFVGTYLAHPPEFEHDLLIVGNGGPLPRGVAPVFDVVKAKFLPRTNDPGWDISAYQQVARLFPCDMLVCLGESVYFHRQGWLRRFVEAWLMTGPGMYGFFSSNLVRAHLNTTAFVTDPKLLMEYPRVRNHAERYDFEHGDHAFWRFVQNKRRPTKLVTWDGSWDPMLWRVPRNILWRGTQGNCLAFCSHTDRYFAADAQTKRKWEAWIDQPFK